MRQKAITDFYAAEPSEADIQQAVQSVASKLGTVQQAPVLADMLMFLQMAVEASPAASSSLKKEMTILKGLCRKDDPRVSEPAVRLLVLTAVLGDSYGADVEDEIFKYLQRPGEASKRTALHLLAQAPTMHDGGKASLLATTLKEHPHLVAEYLAAASALGLADADTRSVAEAAMASEQDPIRFAGIEYARRLGPKVKDLAPDVLEALLRPHKNPVFERLMLRALLACDEDGRYTERLAAVIPDLAATSARSLVRCLDADLEHTYRSTVVLDALIRHPGLTDQERRLLEGMR